VLNKACGKTSGWCKTDTPAGGFYNCLFIGFIYLLSLKPQGKILLVFLFLLVDEQEYE